MDFEYDTLKNDFPKRTSIFFSSLTYVQKPGKLPAFSDFDPSAPQEKSTFGVVFVVVWVKLEQTEWWAVHDLPPEWSNEIRWLVSLGDARGSDF